MCPEPHLDQVQQSLNPLPPVDPFMSADFDAVKNVGTSWVMKVAIKFHQNRVCSFGEESKYLFLGVGVKNNPRRPL